jgi:diacylglycerol O-acyltransferase / wax synthase
MQQLTGLDQMFLALDTATTNGILGGLVLFEPAEDGKHGPDEAFMRERLSERLPYIPPMAKRIVEVPLAMDYGYLATCDRVDVSRHLRTHKLPAPCSTQEIADEVSRLMGAPLETDGPLWDLTVIQDNEQRVLAHLLRIHHGVVDGSTMPQIWDLFSDNPKTDLGDAPPIRSLPEPLFGQAEMWARIAPAILKRPFTFTRFQARYAKWLYERFPEDGVFTIPGQMAKMVPGELGKPFVSLINRRQRAVDQPEITSYIPTLFPPETTFNGRASSRRHFVYDEMNLPEVKALGKQLGTTLNNVVVAICAGAMRRYLLDHGGIPDKPLIVCVPVSLRHDAIEEPWSNHVHMMFAPLPTHIEDPLERVRLVTKDLTTAKSSFDSLPTHLFREASNFMPRDLFHWATEAWIRMPDKLSRGPWNVVVSNVRGPSEPAYMNGVLVKGYWPASFLSIGGGINITLQSYVDRICFGFIGAPDKTGDLWPLVGYMQDALAELKAAADADAEQVDAPADEPIQAAAGSGALRPAARRPRPARQPRSANPAVRVVS